MKFIREIPRDFYYYPFCVVVMLAGDCGLWLSIVFPLLLIIFIGGFAFMDK
jgi:hypothetical protein